ncbi:hypothetical protein BgiMline_001174 [Biomphalaria glabrata]|nr:CAunnamed protein product [Biomphalaria glabrata]
MAFGKRGSGNTKSNLAPPPHWMKQMEEKYQRLHAKIHNQAMRFSSRRHPSTVTRTAITDHCFEDPSVSARRGAQNKGPIHTEYTKISPAVRTGEILTIAPIETACDDDLVCASSGSTLSTGGAEDVCHLDNNINTAECLAAGGVVESPCAEQDYTCVEQELDLNVSTLETGRDSIADFSYPGFHFTTPVSSDNPFVRTVSGDCDVSQYCVDQGNSTSFFHTENNNNNVNAKSNSIIHGRFDDQGENMEISRARRRRRDLRAVKTPGSRLSHKTSQSCPATFFVNNGHDVMGYDLRNNVQGLDSGPFSSRHQPRVFARMSIEARHAVDELRAEDMLQSSRTFEYDTNTSPHLPNVTHGTSNDTSRYHNETHELSNRIREESLITSEQSVVPDLVLRNADATLTSRTDYAADSTANKNSLIMPCSSLGGDISQRMNRIGSKRVNRMLPQLEHGVPPREDFPKTHLPLPDIGHAREPMSLRENTFEITPVDFDIRFHQIIPYNPGDSPPPDIRQQAIEKCQHWLIRHTPRH